MVANSNILSLVANSKLLVLGCQLSQLLFLSSYKSLSCQCKVDILRCQIYMCKASLPSINCQIHVSTVSLPIQSCTAVFCYTHGPKNNLNLRIQTEPLTDRAEASVSYIQYTRTYYNSVLSHTLYPWQGRFLCEDSDYFRDNINVIKKET